MGRPWKGALLIGLAALFLFSPRGEAADIWLKVDDRLDWEAARLADAIEEEMGLAEEKIADKLAQEEQDLKREIFRLNFYALCPLLPAQIRARFQAEAARRAEAGRLRLASLKQQGQESLQDLRRSLILQAEEEFARLEDEIIKEYLGDGHNTSRLP